MVPLGSGRFMHLVVLYGFQGADSDAEQLSLTEQLFDAALGELSVVARGQPCLLVGDFNVEPTKIPCLAKGISAGLWVDLEAAWALAVGILWLVVPLLLLGHNRLLLVRGLGTLLVVIAGISWLLSLSSCGLGAAVSSCRRFWVIGDAAGVFLYRDSSIAPLLDMRRRFKAVFAPHLAVRTLFDCSRWTCSVTQVVQCTPLWPASWLPAVDKSRGSKGTSLEEFDFEVEEWLPLLPEVSLPGLTGQMLADVVQRKSATAGGGTEGLGGL